MRLSEIAVALALAVALAAAALPVQAKGGAAAVGDPPAYQLMQRFELQNAKEKHALCNDGSAPAYFVRYGDKRGRGRGRRVR